METPTPNYFNRNTLAKIARKFCCDVVTLEKNIDGFPKLKELLDTYLSKAKRRGRRILSPSIVKAIFDALGEP